MELPARGSGPKMYYTGTANAYEWNPKNRGGGEMDNVGAASIVAVNTTDGSVAWRYVGVPGDPWTSTFRRRRW